MSKHIRKCDSCNTYTLKEVCPNCSNKTDRIKVMNFSVEDRYGKYRRKQKYGAQ